MNDLVTKVSVQVITHSKSSGVDVISPTSLKVRTSAMPKNNEANVMVQKMLARHYGLPLSHIILKSGENLRKKIFLIIEK
jgi:uncharacterized protein YggU (UPF0235/DUF167 family)